MECKHCGCKIYYVATQITGGFHYCYTDSEDKDIKKEVEDINSEMHDSLQYKFSKCLRCRNCGAIIAKVKNVEELNNVK